MDVDVKLVLLASGSELGSEVEMASGSTLGTVTTLLGAGAGSAFW